MQKLEITRERIAQELAEIAFAKATDYVSVETEPAPRLIIHPLTGEPVTIPGGICQTVRIADTDQLPEDKKTAIASIKQGANGIEVKTHDKVRALEMLGKMLGMFDARETPPEQENNLFDAIVGSMEEVLDTDDLPEVEQAQLLAMTWWNRPKFQKFDGIICDGSIRSGKPCPCQWALFCGRWRGLTAPCSLSAARP